MKYKAKRFLDWEWNQRRTNYNLLTIYEWKLTPCRVREAAVDDEIVNFLKTSTQDLPTQRSSIVHDIKTVNCKNVDYTIQQQVYRRMIHNVNDFA